MAQARAAGVERRNAMGRTALASGFALLFALPQAAQAHVRWFTGAAHADTAPESMETLLASLDFLALSLVTLAVLAWVRRADTRLAAGQSSFMRLLADFDARATPAAAPVLRVAVAVFFAAAAVHFGDASFAWTPELTSPGDWVVPLKLLIALGLLFPSGVLPACAGMLVLYLHPAHLPGAGQLLDYELFFGVCVFLALDHLSPRQGATTGLLVLRILVAGNFLWVGIERWLYPDWTAEALVQRLPMLQMGLDPAFWTLAAGFVEVALAFVLLFGGASSQVAAAVMLVLMAGTMPMLDPMEAISDLPMLFSLFVLAATRNRMPRAVTEHARWQPANLCRTFLLATMGLTVLYYLAHDFTPVLHAQLADLWREVVLVGLGTEAPA